MPSQLSTTPDFNLTLLLPAAAAAAVVGMHTTDVQVVADEEHACDGGALTLPNGAPND